MNGKRRLPAQGQDAAGAGPGCCRRLELQQPRAAEAEVHSAGASGVDVSASIDGSFISVVGQHRRLRQDRRLRGVGQRCGYACRSAGPALRLRLPLGWARLGQEQHATQPRPRRRATLQRCSSRSLGLGPARPRPPAQQRPQSWLPGQGRPGNLNRRGARKAEAHRHATSPARWTALQLSLCRHATSGRQASRKPAPSASRLTKT